VNNKQITCDPERIELFLQQKLSDEEQTAFELHLDDCEDCRRRLEAAAAGDDVWSGVRDSLRGEQLPPDGLRSGDPALDAGLDSATGGDASFSHDTVLKLLAPTDDDRMLGRLGTHEVVGVIGSGGMGVVLKGFDAALNRYVAIKVLAPHLGSSGAARKRFSREAQAAAAVVHDNVMEIHGVAGADGLPYLVMPYVRGPSLQRRLDDDGPLALVEILRIAVQAAAGLAAAHAQGLVHRDVKPANILLADGVERVKLTDFGLAWAADDASLTRTGVIAGTPQYMSPEQARGESVDQRSDLFSLGSVLYAMCTGRAPFRAETSYGVLRRITDEEPRPIRQLNPDVPEWLCRIIARLMSKQPEDRFESAREVAELLEKCLAHVQQPTAVPLPASLVTRSGGSRFFSTSLRTLGVIVMIATFGLLLGIVLWQSAEAPDTNEPRSTPDSTAAQTQPAEAQPKTAMATPKRVRHFTTSVTGGDATIAYSADGKLIAIANGNPTMILGGGISRVADNWKPSADILDAETGKTVVSLKLGTNDEDALLAATERVSHFEVKALAFSPDGSVVAVGTSIGQVKLFNARTGELVRSLDDEQAKRADKDTPKDWQSFPRAMGTVASLAFSPDGSLLAVCGGSFSDFSIRFNDARRTRATSAARSTGPGRLKVWEVKTGTLKYDLVGHGSANAVAFSPDGNLLASVGYWTTKHARVGGAGIWNPHTGAKIRNISTDANSGVRSVAFSPDSKLVAIGSMRFFDKDGFRDASSGAVSLTDVSSGVTQWLQTVPGWVGGVEFSPDGKSVAVLCGSQSIRFLGTKTAEVRHEIRSADSPQGGRWTDFAIAPQGRMLAIGGVDNERKGSVELWDLDGLGTAASSAPIEVGGEMGTNGEQTEAVTGQSPISDLFDRDEGIRIRTQFAK